MIVQIIFNNCGRGFIDIGIGPSGSEVVIAPDLWFVGSAGPNASITYTLPVAIPAGTRIAARCNGPIGNATYYLNLILLDSNFMADPSGSNRMKAFTADAANGRGVAQASGGFNSKGSWVTLGTTDEKAKGFMVVHTPQAWFGVDMSMLIDIGIGAAGSEQILVADNHCIGYASSGWSPMIFGPFWIPLPSGTRVSLRKAQNYNGSATTYAMLYTFH
jgi:hypothetical protein